MPECRPFPHKENDYGANHQTAGKEALYKQQRAEHHQVIPVKDATSRAAAVFHNKMPEGTPEQHADQITNVKNRTDNQKPDIIQDACFFQ